MTIPNCYLCASTDVHGNEIQALVPFGEDGIEIFKRMHPDWSGERPDVRATIYGATIRQLFAME